MNVFITGIGLIGGSLALAIKNDYVTISGYDTNSENGKTALELGVLDVLVDDFQQGAEQADVIILACPVTTICHYMEQLAQCQLKADVIITDVGSTKQKVMEQATVLRKKGITFIGGHPMAGSHKSGVLAATPSLFENAYYVLTPFADCKTASIEVLQTLLSPTNAYLVVLDSMEHDEVTGMISHFPHLVAASLVRQAHRFTEQHPIASDMAAGGFRDITRIASSSPVMWRDIIMNNRENMLAFLEEWTEEMTYMREVVKQGQPEELLRYFTSAKTFRDSLPIRQSGAIPAFYDLYVDILDYSGAIASVTTIIAEAEINIKNLGIMEAREGLLGVFRISFRNDSDRMKAKALLEQKGYATDIKL